MSWFLVALALLAPPAALDVAEAGSPPSGAVQPAAEGCSLAQLPGLRGQWLRAWRDVRPLPGAAAGAGSRLEPTRADDLSRVARAVLGPDGDLVASAAAVTPDPAVGAPTLPPPACGVEARRRDAAAWHLALAGFSAREVADVLGGHLAVDDVLQARARLMAGQPRALVEAFLEQRWRAPSPPPSAAAAMASPAAPVLALPGLDLALDDLARSHDVPAGLVRAVIAAESAGNPRAVSSAGAVGLMQLMPGTAAALGVNPWEPLDNLRGGIAYLGGLLREFDRDARLALIAYNAGPQHARDVRAGRAVAYRETRAYLEAIGARFPLPPP